MRMSWLENQDLNCKSWRENDERIAILRQAQDKLHRSPIGAVKLVSEKSFPPTLPSALIPLPLRPQICYRQILSRN
jgi:hypothetical protein